MQLIPYDARYKDDFIQMNTAWILDYFGFLEQEDTETFAGIDEELARGAMIYFAVEDDTALATCMARPMEAGTWEICKLGSNPHREHKGCGSAVFRASMQWAIDHGAKRLFIVTNRRLKAAIHIYEKYGFREIPMQNYGYARGDIAFEKRI